VFIFLFESSALIKPNENIVTIEGTICVTLSVYVLHVTTFHV